jgi:hypothetical protein
MQKKTGELDFELKRSKSVHDYIKANDGEFTEGGFHTHLNELISQCGKPKSRIIAAACVSQPYFYNITRGEKRPERDTVIKLTFGLGLGAEQCERLLTLAGHGAFYVRRKKDAVLKFALVNGHTLAEADEMLARHGFSILTD